MQVFLMSFCKVGTRLFLQKLANFGHVFFQFPTKKAPEGASLMDGFSFQLLVRETRTLFGFRHCCWCALALHRTVSHLP